MNKKDQDKLYVINIDEEGRFMARKANCSSRFSFKNYNIETTVVIPAKDSKIFSDFITEHNIRFDKLNITRLSKHWFTLIKYVLLFPIELTVLTLYLKKIMLILFI